MQNGTLVSFTTTIGRIEPREARTQNGEVRVRFVAGGQRDLPANMRDAELLDDEIMEDWQIPVMAAMADELETTLRGCEVPRLSVLGERWTLVVLRQAFLGARRFEQFTEEVPRLPGVLGAYHVSGAIDYYVHVATESAPWPS